MKTRPKHFQCDRDCFCKWAAQTIYIEDILRYGTKTI